MDQNGWELMNKTLFYLFAIILCLCSGFLMGLAGGNLMLILIACSLNYVAGSLVILSMKDKNNE
jgi:Na+/serine symporter